MREWERISGQEARVPLEKIEAFEARLLENRVNIHGFAMVDRGKLLAERYFGGYGKDTLHRMYSAGKSFTSLAIGLLEQEGKLSTEDFICDYFRDKCPEKVHPWTEQMTIRDMLCMTTSHSRTTYKRYDGDWVESFFCVEPDNLPGAVFSYDTSSTHVLSALVERLSGMKLLDYLRRKAFDRIGFSKEAYFIPDPAGVSQGGSGLMCTLRDMLSVAELVQNGGSYQGEQLLPAAYVREAVSCQVPTVQQTAFDESFGYGYQIWQGRHDSFYFYGIGGQLAVCFPGEQFIFASMGNTIGNPNGIKDIFDAFYEIIYPCLNGERQQPVSGMAHSPLESKISGAEYVFDGNDLKLEQLRVRIEGDRGELELEKGGRRFLLNFGWNEFLDGELAEYGYKYRCRGSWVREDYLFLDCQTGGAEMTNLTMSIRFVKDTVTLRMKRFPDEYLPDFDGVASGRQKNSGI